MIGADPDQDREAEGMTGIEIEEAIEGGTQDLDLDLTHAAAVEERVGEMVETVTGEDTLAQSQEIDADVAIVTLVEAEVAVMIEEEADLLTIREVPLQRKEELNHSLWSLTSDWLKTNRSEEEFYPLLINTTV